MGKFGKNTLVRIASGIVMAVVIIGGLLLSEFGLLAIAVLACLACLWEFYRLAEGGAGTQAASDEPGRKAWAQPLKVYSMVVGGAAVTLSFLVARGSIAPAWTVCLLPALTVLFVAELYRRKDNPVANISVSLAGLFYVALSLSLLVQLAFRKGAYDPWFVLAIIGIVSVNDIFAYFTGVSFGRHKMFERISPKKSWEGFAGGLVFAIAAAVLCGHLMGENLVAWGIAGALIVAGAVFGDLVESLFKRSAGVKDSGNLIPGHGGALDRMDAILFTVPLVYFYFTIFVG